MKIASIFLAVLASTSVRASTNSPVDVILSRGCGGNYQLLPKLPFGMSIDVPTLEHAFTGIFTKLRDRAKCQCPSLSDNDFDLLFDPITGALNAASSNTKYPAGCPGLFPRNITDFADVINVNLPSTCTLDLWQTEGQCSMKYDWSPQVTFGVAIKKCPASPIPAITINCLGCTDLAKPCSTDSDCGKHKCNSVTNWASHQDTVMNLFENFKNAHLFDDGDAQPGCSQNKFQPTSANDMLTSALSFIKNEIYGDGGDVPELKFCGIDQFSNANMTGLMTLVDQPLTPPRCYLPEYSSGKNMTITYLQPWADGQNFLNASPIIPAPNLSNAPIGHFRILQTSCDGQFMLMNGAIRVRMAHAFIRTFEKFDNILYAMQKCRRDGSLMLRQFLTRFGMWTLYPYMYSMDGSTYPDQFFLGPSMSDWVTNMFTRHTATQSYQKPNFIYGLPETCDFQNLLKTGGCNVQFNGISSLLNMDVQAELHVATCASSTGDTPMFIQSLAVDMTCGGDWNCSETTFISCETNYDCPTNMQCLDFKKMLPLASGDVIGDYFFPIRNKNIQPEKFSGTLCSSSNVGYDSDTTCGSPLKTDQDMSYVVAQLVGMDPSKMSQKGGIKMCSFDQQAFNSTSLSNWAMTQVQSKENGFVVANLKSISAPSDLLVGSATPQEDPQTQNSSDGSMLTASGGVGFAALFFAYLLI